MSQELERVYTINLGKVLLSPDNQRAKRAINMIKEFARHHMKTEEIKIEEDVAHQIWSRGIRSPPRKIRVRMTKTDEGFILISPYDADAESTSKSDDKESPKLEKVSTEVDTPTESPTVETVVEEKKEAPAKDKPKKEAPAKDTSKTKKQ